MGDPLSRVVFASAAGPIEASTDCDAPSPGSPGVRVRVRISAEALQRAYDGGAFDLAAVIPGGDVPGIDPTAPVDVELRLADGPTALLAASSRAPGVLLGDLVGLSDAGRTEHVLLDGSSWQVAAIGQTGGVQLTTIHHDRDDA